MVHVSLQTAHDHTVNFSIVDTHRNCPDSGGCLLYTTCACARCKVIGLMSLSYSSLSSSRKNRKISRYRLHSVLCHAIAIHSLGYVLCDVMTLTYIQHARPWATRMNNAALSAVNRCGWAKGTIPHVCDPCLALICRSKEQLLYRQFWQLGNA